MLRGPSLSQYASVDIQSTCNRFSPILSSTVGVEVVQAQRSFLEHERGLSPESDVSDDSGYIPAAPTLQTRTFLLTIQPDRQSLPYLTTPQDRPARIFFHHINARALHRSHPFEQLRPRRSWNTRLLACLARDSSSDRAAPGRCRRTAASPPRYRSPVHLTSTSFHVYREVALRRFSSGDIVPLEAQTATLSIV